MRRLKPLAKAVAYNQRIEIAPGIQARLVDAGHVIGSASVELTVEEQGRKKVVVFSGDLGPRGAPLLNDPAPFEQADVVIMESNSGGRMSTTDVTQRTNRVSLADEEGVKRVLVDSILGLWDVVNNLTRLQPSRRDRYRVTIFGSARAKPGTIAYEETKRVATALTEMGCDIITGGGPGLMQAANAGAAAVGERGKSLGIRVDLPFEQEVNPFVELAFEHRTFFTRLHHFVLASDAFIVAPGGIGTVLETLMIWQLLQVRHLDDTPLILVGRMWPGLIEWARTSMLSFEPPLANAEDIEIARCVANGEEAIALIRDHHSRWRLAQAAAM